MSKRFTDKHYAALAEIKGHGAAGCPSVWFRNNVIADLVGKGYIRHDLRAGDGFVLFVRDLDDADCRPEN